MEPSASATVAHSIVSARLCLRNAFLTLTSRRLVNSPVMPIGRNSSRRIMMTA